MRRTRALGIGLFFGMVICMFLGTTDPVLAARCIEECESEQSACAAACVAECNGVTDCINVCGGACGTGYNNCMQHSVYCSSSYCYNWSITWGCTYEVAGWWCAMTSKQCTLWG